MRVSPPMRGCRSAAASSDRSASIHSNPDSGYRLTRPRLGRVGRIAIRQGATACPGCRSTIRSAPAWLSTLAAALPIGLLLVTLGRAAVAGPPRGARRAGSRRWPCRSASSGCRCPAALATAIYGAAYGLFPIGWIVLCAIFLYNLSVRSGTFDVVKRSVARLSGDRRIQALLIAFSFGAFIEGRAGFGTPVAISAALLMGLGFAPRYAASLSLIANTAPVAFGAIGTPILTLAAVTGLPGLHARRDGRAPAAASCRCSMPAWLVVDDERVARPARRLAGRAGRAAGPSPSSSSSGATSSAPNWWTSPGASCSLGARRAALPVVAAARSSVGQASAAGAPYGAERQPPALRARDVLRGLASPWILLSRVRDAVGHAAGEGARSMAAGGLATAQHRPSAVAAELAAVRRSRPAPARVPGIPGRAHAGRPGTRRRAAYRDRPRGGGRLHVQLALGDRHERSSLAATRHRVLLRMRRDGMSLEVARDTSRQMRRSLADDRHDDGARVRHALRRHRRDARTRVHAGRAGSTRSSPRMLGWLGVALTGSDTSSNVLFGSLQKITAAAARPEPGAHHHGEQHRRRDGQDDRRPDDRGRHRGDGPAGRRRRRCCARSSGTAWRSRRSWASSCMAQAYLVPWMIPAV